MVRAWRRAGTALTPTPELDARWTRTCFCGQATEGGNVADYPMIGFPFLTGSEEERGPLFDVLGIPFVRGDRRRKRGDVDLLPTTTGRRPR